MVKPTLSIIIPAYNEEKRINNALTKIANYLKNENAKTEVIVVDDGSTDRTLNEVKKCEEKIENLVVIQNRKNQGKGSSVRNGMLHAKGSLVLFSDADLSTPIEELDKLTTAIKEGYQIAIASRALSESDIQIHQPWYRELIGKTYNLFVRAIVVKGIRDTQCGFKLFTERAAKKIFPKQKINDFGFDIEILYLAKKFGLSVKEVPVIWRNSNISKIHPIKDPIKMFADLARVRINDLKGVYK